MSVLVYALGGGAGHVVRGASLAAAMARSGTPSAVLVPSDRAPIARALHDGVVAATRPPTSAALAATVMRAIERLGTTHLVVDALPEGVLGELGELDALSTAAKALRRTAVLRARRDGRDPSFLRSLERYDEIFDVEPALAWMPEGRAIALSPVARDLARAESALDVLVALGDGELEGVGRRLAERLARAGLTTEVRARGDALLDGELLSARVVVGAAGYNLTYELARLGTFHVALPLRRRFDDQRARARRQAIVCRGPEALERAVIALVRGGGRREPAETITHAELARALRP